MHTKEHPLTPMSCHINKACSWSSSSTTFLLSPLPFLLGFLGRLKPDLRGTRSCVFLR
ncbi:hypothetical protein Hanom_Chr03g00272471 [Helianthus anomalus]